MTTSLNDPNLDLSGMKPVITPPDDDPMADLINRLSTSEPGCQVCHTSSKLAWWGNSAITHCRVCHRTWSRTSREGHCVVCHRHFGGQTAFDAHMAGTKHIVHGDPVVKEGRPPYTQDQDGVWRAAPPAPGIFSPLGLKETADTTTTLGSLDPPNGPPSQTHSPPGGKL